MKNKLSIYSIFCTLLCTILLSSCIEEFDGNIPQEKGKLLVVEGTIRSDTFNCFYLNYSLPIKPDSSYLQELWSEGKQFETVKYADVTIHGTNGSIYQLEGGWGFFYTNLAKLDPGVEYYLRIETDGDIYETIPEKPVATPDIDSIEHYQATKESTIDVLINTQKMENTKYPIYYEWDMNETWEVRPDYLSVWYYDPVKRDVYTDFDLYPKRGWKFVIGKETMVASTVHYANQQLQKYKLYGIAHTDERIFCNYSGLIMQRAISKGEYEYKLATIQTSSEMGGLFSPQASSFPTNIRCINGSKRAIGYVGVSLNDVKKRFYIRGNEVYKKRPEKISEIIDINPSKKMYHDYWQSNFGISKYEGDPTRLLKVGWVPLKYIDLKLRDDLFFEKPDYMP